MLAGVCEALALGRFQAHSTSRPYRRLLNGIPKDYQQYLALYKGISAKHSSIDNIVQHAHYYKKTMTLWKFGRGTERWPDNGPSMPLESGQQKTYRLHNR
jgi:hypothetical protein